MEPKRYWWMCYELAWISGGEVKDDKVVDIHPFIVIDEISKNTPEAGCILLSWKLISAEEYNLFNELNNTK